MQRHWMVTLQNLSSSGRSWDADVPKALLEDELYGSVNVLPGLAGDVHWQLSLQREGSAFRLNGSWEACLARSCSRCTAGFNWSVAGASERLYQFSSSSDKKSDTDEDEQSYDYIERPGEVNLLDVLREDIWLAWKADVICSDTCKGLCQGCGVNLNTSPCQCVPDDSNNPFAALRSLKLDG